jgi:hypothetical protein
MNIIMISVEACGPSSIGPIISQMHEVFTGERIYWQYEISRVLASSNDYIFPKGFCSVFYVDPKNVLTRPFDKVIILQRPLEKVLVSLFDRLDKRGKPYDKEEAKAKMEDYYDVIYNQELDDEKVFKVQLQDFANYPVATFSDLFDFLGYPKKHRPIIFPFPIWHHPEDQEYTPKIPELHRDWIKRSSILRKGHEELATTKDEYTQMVNVIKPNPYKFTPEEYYIQGKQVYRIGRGTTDALEVLHLV